MKAPAKTARVKTQQVLRRLNAVPKLCTLGQTGPNSVQPISALGKTEPVRWDTRTVIYLFGWLSVLAFCLLTPSARSVAQTKAEQRTLALLARPPATLVGAIKVTGDSLDPQISISTRGVTAITSKGLLASTTSENSFLRAFINRKTGAVSAQVHHSMNYGGRGFDTFSRATYEAPGGIEEAVVSQVSSDVSCARYRCTHYSDVVFPIKVEVLREASKSFDPAKPLTGIRYRVFGQSGTNMDDLIPANEIVALVQVIDREVASLKP